MPNKTVAIALSGGVDSSTAAAMLLEKGYNVIGVTMLVCPVTFKRWDGSEYTPNLGEIEEKMDRLNNSMFNFAAPHKILDSDENYGTELCFHPLCTLLDSKRICTQLGIRHFIIDLRDEFKDTIIDYFAGEYNSGRTPNPCVICNPTIKFGKLMQYALDLGANMFATGHYARVVKNESSGLFELYRGVDKSKDQAYALYRLKQDQLAKLIFPLGEMTKTQTRQYARSINLPVMDKSESQEICFIPDDDYIGFLKKNYPVLVKPGAILNSKGEKLGEHKGLIYYTVGQRRRLGISHHKPLYVLSIDAKNNTLIVGYYEDLLQKSLKVNNLSWIAGSPPSDKRVLVKIRYSHPQAPATIALEKNSVKVIFDEPQRAVAPGQSAVFYSYPDGETVLGGGVIEDKITI